MIRREILFRGKRKDNREWVYGLLVRKIDDDGNDIFCIQTWNRDREGVSSRVEDVMPGTVGQFTGLTDTNGKKIFEGDILQIEDSHDHIKFIAIVEFGNSDCYCVWGWQLRVIGGDTVDDITSLRAEKGCICCEIIGNITGIQEF